MGRRRIPRRKGARPKKKRTRALNKNTPAWIMRETVRLLNDSVGDTISDEAKNDAIFFIKPIMDYGLDDDPSAISIAAMAFAVSDAYANNIFPSDLKVEGRDIIITFDEDRLKNLSYREWIESEAIDAFHYGFSRMDFEEKMGILYHKQAYEAMCKGAYAKILDNIGEAYKQNKLPKKRHTLFYNLVFLNGLFFGAPKEKYLSHLEEMVALVGSKDGPKAEWYSDNPFEAAVSDWLKDTTSDCRDWMLKNRLFHWAENTMMPESKHSIYTKHSNGDFIERLLLESGGALEKYYDTSNYETWARHSAELDMRNRSVGSYIKQLRESMSFVIDPDTRELIINQGLPSRIHPEFMRLPYSSMYLDVRLPLPSGTLLEGLTLHEIDNTQWEKYRFNDNTQKAVVFDMSTCETLEMEWSDIPHTNRPIIVCNASSGEFDNKRSWLIDWVEASVTADGTPERHRYSRELGVCTWDEEPEFPTRPRKSGDTKDDRYIVDFIIGLLLFIQLPDVEWVDAGQKGSAKAIKKREARRKRQGLPPLPERKTIRLSGEVKRYVNRIASAEGSGTRYHQVRGHFRTLRSERYKEMRGRVIWVKEHHKGWGSNTTQTYEVKK
tara:strand:+ start:1251 stop:3074 length:1824 start_codon:yes stop_codon:yes gene_type:complete